MRLDVCMCMSMYQFFVQAYGRGWKYIFTPQILLWLHLTIAATIT